MSHAYHVEPCDLVWHVCHMGPTWSTHDTQVIHKDHMDVTWGHMDVTWMSHGGYMGVTWGVMLGPCDSHVTCYMPHIISRWHFWVWPAVPPTNLIVGLGCAVKKNLWPVKKLNLKIFSSLSTLSLATLAIRWILHFYSGTSQSWRFKREREKA